VRQKYVTLQVAATYMGAVIGAGFASGQELVYFFVRYKNAGFLGLGLTGVLFALLGMLTIKMVNHFEVGSYTELITKTMGRGVGRALDIWLTIFLFVGLCIMLAGSAAVFVEHLKAPFWVGLLLTVVCLLSALLAGGEGILLFNTCLMPLLLIITLIVSFSAVGQEAAVNGEFLAMDAVNTGLLGESWLLASVLYVSYNMIIGVVVLTSIPLELRRNSLWGGMLGGLALGFLGLVMAWALGYYYPQVLAYEIPMLFVAGQVNPLLKLPYTMALWFAMLTTALANAFSLAQRMSGGGRDYHRTVLVILALALPFAGLSFAQMVTNIYPLFGYIGLFVILLIFVSGFIKYLKQL